MIISSQRYLDYGRVDSKIEEISGRDSVTLRIVLAGEIDGEAAYVLIDGHHTGEAARELGIEINFEEVSRNDAGYDERWTMGEMLENLWIDSDWYNYETGELVF